MSTNLAILKLPLDPTNHDEPHCGYKRVTIMESTSSIRRRKATSSRKMDGRDTEATDGGDNGNLYGVGTDLELM